jgi:Cytochrome C oxidase, cbb3-type, subunit III
MNFRKAAILLFLLMILTGIHLLAQEWVVPEEYKTKTSPFKFTADSIKKGETVFIKNCQSCHGNPGKKNMARIIPEPGDPVSDKFQAQTDGEMFYRITSGKIPMPEFRNILAENERWNVISYLRSFNAKYVQPNPEQKTAFSGKQVTLSLQYRKEIEKIQVMATEVTPDKKIVPAKGVEVVLFVKRYFGNMKLGEPKMTNDKGEVLFDIPANLPGDRQGFVDLTAMVNDNSGRTSEARVKATVSAGKPTLVPSLIATRAWWTVREDAPIWVILTYSLSVIIVWGFIVRIVYSVFRIRKI